MKAFRASARVGSDTVQAKSAALLDPSVMAAVLAEAPAMYVADAAGRLILTTPRLDEFHRGSGPGSSGAAMSHWTPVAEPLERLRRGEDEVTADLTLPGIGALHAVHRRSRDGGGKLVFRGVFQETPGGIADAVPTAGDARQRFLGRIHHELRTPLNAIIGFSEMSLTDVEGRLRGQHRSYFQDITRAARALLGTIEEILAVVDAETDPAKPALRATDAAGVIAETAAPVLAIAREKGIDLVLPDASRAVRVMADPDHLARIVDSLLRGAVAATGPGGRIGVELVDAGRGQVHLSVWDTAIGAVPAEDDIYASPGADQGIGVAVARTLARAMDGELSHERGPEPGTRFTLRLPQA